MLVASMKKNLQSKSPNPIGLLDYFDIWAASRKSKKAVLDFFDSLSPPPHAMDGTLPVDGPNDSTGNAINSHSFLREPS